MSSEGVRPVEALSTDSAIVGLAVLVPLLEHFKLFGTGYNKVARPAGIILILNVILYNGSPDAWTY